MASEGVWKWKVDQGGKYSIKTISLEFVPQVDGYNFSIMTIGVTSYSLREGVKSVSLEVEKIVEVAKLKAELAKCEIIWF
ncbi:hypothetical protein L195_g012386 [Trifolium pratense]|uniref:Uncharacterized protein n=1 Tax=Trifolium pratense TaxID=57577 RepID=A0A2K3PK98_TRIPR|nr:hypothetical protein L195_g012386 [Trifolium pratense]